MRILLRDVNITASFWRGCHTEALVGLVSPDKDRRAQAYTGQPYHLADGLDLRPDDRPAVVMTTASVVQVARYSPPSDGSRRSQGEQRGSPRHRQRPPHR